MLRSTNILTSTVISTAAKLSNKNDQRPWLNGAKLRLEARILQNFGDWFDTNVSTCVVFTGWRRYSYSFFVWREIKRPINPTTLIRGRVLLL